MKYKKWSLTEKLDKLSRAEEVVRKFYEQY
jgi:hypothetical protein